MTAQANKAAQSSAPLAALTANEGDGDADEGGGGGDGVRAVVPGVALDGGAAQLVANPGDKAEEGSLDGDNEGEDQDCEPGGA